MRTAMNSDCTSSSSRPPGPPALPWLGNALELTLAPLSFLERSARRHGDIVQLRAAGQTIYLFSHPAHIEQLLVESRDHVIKDEPTRALSAVLGNGLLVNEGEPWRKRRRLTQPAFHRQRLEGYAEVMVRYAEEMVDGLCHGQRRDMHHELMQLTLRIVARTLFGTELGSDAHRIGHAIDGLIKPTSVAGPLLFFGMRRLAERMLKAPHEELDDVVYGLIRRRREEGDQGDLLSMLLAARDEDGQSLDDRALRDEAVTMLLAGHETTALALTYSLHLLTRHPEVRDELRRELHAVLGDRRASYADLPRLCYTDAVVREALRLYPPVWGIGREAVAPCAIGGCTVEKGAQLWAVQWVVQRDPRWFPEPLRFRPARWLESSRQKLPRFAFFPFGGGPRVCIGSSFAMMEATLLLATIMRAVDFEADGASSLEVTPAVTLRPKGGLPLRIVH